LPAAAVESDFLSHSSALRISGQKNIPYFTIIKTLVIYLKITTKVLMMWIAYGKISNIFLSFIIFSFHIL